MSKARNDKRMTSAVHHFEHDPLSDVTTSASLRNGAAHRHSAPTSANGCVSDISADAFRNRTYEYTAAMKNYGLVYAEYQSYLMPAEQLLTHDYDMAAKLAPSVYHVDCLPIELAASTTHSDDVSDDDIEHCGYMAWVRH